MTTSTSQAQIKTAPAAALTKAHATKRRSLAAPSKAKPAILPSSWLGPKKVEGFVEYLFCLKNMTLDAGRARILLNRFQEGSYRPAQMMGR